MIRCTRSLSEDRARTPPFPDFKGGVSSLRDLSGRSDLVEDHRCLAGILDSKKHNRSIGGVQAAVSIFDVDVRAAKLGRSMRQLTWPVGKLGLRDLGVGVAESLSVQHFLGCCV